jgi:FkbM family methyltransferase
VAAKLRDNVALNGLQNVTVNELAISDLAGHATFYLTDESDQNSLIPCEGRRVNVETARLDDYLTSRQISHVDVMKIDVEGAEARVLRGASGLLSGDRPPVILLEFNPPALERGGSSENELRGILSGHGYSCHTVTSYANGGYFNVIASRPFHYERFPQLMGFREVAGRK